MFGRRSTQRPRSTAPEDAVVEREEIVETGHAWNPAQIVAFVIGAAALAFGIVALLRTGLDFDDLYGPEETVLGFVHTPLLAIAEIAFGVLMLLAALSPGGRALMAFLGAVALAFGILVVADVWPARLHDWFGVRDRNGWLFVAVGGVSLFAALFLPTLHGRDRRRVTERRRVGGPHAVQ